MTPRIDLHTHTTASDGRLTPEALIVLAQERQLGVIAITDHDTTDGISIAQQAAGESPVVIPGIELSAEDDSGDVHVLGYFIDCDNQAFQQTLVDFRNARESRAKKIVDNLATLGLPLSWERVLHFADGGTIGRPHIAEAMIEAGYVSERQEAFERYLYNGAPAYVPRKRMSVEESIALIHSAGGAAVIAHPGLIPNYEAIIERVIPAGLDGVEVVHPKNPPNVQAHLRKIAAKYNLIMTGGSDFHHPEADGSITLGTVTPPDGCLDALRARAKRYA